MSTQELIREVNAKIRELSRSAYSDDDHPLDFLCECGCLGRVTLMMSVYDAMDAGVFADGHGIECSDPVSDAPTMRERLGTARRRRPQRRGLGDGAPAEA